MAWLVEPDLIRAAEFLRAELPELGLNRRCLLAVGRCQVAYQGRASSTLADGDRVLVVKADGTLLIHTPRGLKPVNWQPPGCAFSVIESDNLVILQARRTQPAETVRVEFRALELLGTTLLDDDTVLDLRGTEFDIRDALRARPELVEPGFRPWERERITERGPMDLYGEDAAGRRVVIEVKRVAAGIAEATQLWRYVEKERTKRGVGVRGILVAPSASERALALLRDHGLEFRAIDLASLQAAGAPLAKPRQPSLFSYATEPATPKRRQTQTKRT